MVSYMMDTRKRVVEYLNGCKEPVSFNSIRHLGTDTPSIRWESVVAIVRDLEQEKFVRIHVVRSGHIQAFMVSKK
jgi:hypothetical protein